MTARGLLAARLDRWGAPLLVALVRHSRQSLARFHPLLTFPAWQAEFEAAAALLAARRIEWREVPADDAPQYLATSDQLARWAESRLPMTKGEPYRLGLSLSHSGGRKGQPAVQELGWFILRLGRDDSGIDHDPG